MHYFLFFHARKNKGKLVNAILRCLHNFFLTWANCITQHNQLCDIFVFRCIFLTNIPVIMHPSTRDYGKRFLLSYFNLFSFFSPKSQNLKKNSLVLLCVFSLSIFFLFDFLKNILNGFWMHFFIFIFGIKWIRTCLKCITFVGII